MISHAEFDGDKCSEFLFGDEVEVLGKNRSTETSSLMKKKLLY